MLWQSLMDDMSEQEQVADPEIGAEEVASQEPVVEKTAEQVEAETEARKYGWRPKEEFDRDPEGWVDASRFMELPATHLKMQRDITKRLQKELQERDDRLSNIERTAKMAVEAARKQERTKYEAELESIRKERRAAAEEGDVARIDALDKREDEVRKNAPAVDDEPRTEATAIAPEIQTYLDANDWTKNPAAISFARGAIDLNREIQLLPPMKQVEWAEKKVREAFPELFPAQKRASESKVDPGGLGLLTRKSGKSADDLPADAKAIGKEFVSQGLFKSIDEYAKSYFAQE